MTARIVLVVDDQVANTVLLECLLQLHGYQVLAAANAEQALAALARCRPDLILMDLQLPGIDGLELTRTLKANAATAAIPVVAVTSFAMSGDRQRALAAGCQDYVAKPIDTRALPGIVARHIEAAAGGAAASVK